MVIESYRVDLGSSVKRSEHRVASSYVMIIVNDHRGVVLRGTREG